MTTTLNPSDKSASVTLSNGNLTCTVGAGVAGAVRSTTSKSSGKWYWEVTLGTNIGGTGSAPFMSTGFSNSSEVLSTTAGRSGNNGCCYSTFDNGIEYEGSASTHAALAPVSGDVICNALDFTNKNYWVRKNGGQWNLVATADPGSNTKGIANDATDFPLINAGDLATLLNAGTIFVHVSADGTNITVNFGATAFAQTAPSGFAAWDPGLINASIAQTLQKVTQAAANITTGTIAQRLQKVNELAAASIVAAAGNTAFTATWTIG